MNREGEEPCPLPMQQDASRGRGLERKPLVRQRAEQTSPAKKHQARNPHSLSGSTTARPQSVLSLLSKLKDDHIDTLFCRFAMVDRNHVMVFRLA